MVNVINKLSSLTIHTKSRNYLEDPLLSAYFLSKEAKAYYLSLKHVDTKRNYHAQLIESINKFLSLIDAANIEILNFYIFQKSNIKANSSIEIEKFHPEGYALLEITPPLTLKSLKKHYKKSVMKHHPDRGGCHEKMLIINDAYTAYQGYLCGHLNTPEDKLKEKFNTNNFYAVPRDANDYIYLLNSLLSEVYCDEWDLLNSYLTIKNLQAHEFYNSEMIKTGEEKFKLAAMASTLTKRLAYANLDLEAKEMMEFTKYICTTGGLPYKQYIEEPKKIIDRTKTLRVIINHIRQADNALSLKVISTSRYKNLFKRFEKNKEIEKSKEMNLSTYLDAFGFIEELVYDKGANKVSSQFGDIPEINYFEKNKLHQLSKDQQAEYFLAFSNRSSLTLVKKYTYVRLASYILSIELEYNQKQIDKIYNECAFLSDLYDTPQIKDKNTMELIINISFEINQLKKLEESDGIEKIKSIKNRFVSVFSERSSTFTVTT